jgi:hypothetical protein
VLLQIHCPAPSKVPLPARPYFCVAFIFSMLVSTLNTIYKIQTVLLASLKPAPATFLFGRKVDFFSISLVQNYASKSVCEKNFRLLIQI